MSDQVALLEGEITGVTQEGLYHALSDRREKAHEAESNSDGEHSELFIASPYALASPF